MILVTSMITRTEPMTLDELYGHLLTHEQRLVQQNVTIDVGTLSAQHATCTSQGRGTTPCTSSGGSNSSRQFSSSSGDG